jgi:hypothetical protein
MVASPTPATVGLLGEKSMALARMKLSWMLMPSWVTTVVEERCPLMTVFVLASRPLTPA